MSINQQLKYTLLHLLFNKKQNIQGQIKVLQKRKKGNIFGSFSWSMNLHIHHWTGGTMNLSCETMEEIRFAISI